MSTFVTVAAFVDVSEAHIVRGLLESEGIASVLGSEHHVGAVWPLSSALGGVRLQVSPGDRARADELLQAYHSGEYERALSDQLGLVLPSCPNCGSSARRPERSWLSMLMLLPALLAGIIFPPRQIGSRCSSCGAKVPDVL